MPNLNDIDFLLSYLPYFKDTGNEFYSVVYKTGHLPFISYSFKVNAFISDMYYRNKEHRFYGPDKVIKYSNEPDLLKKANLPILQSLFISIVKGERIVDGLLGGLLDDGTMVNILLRLEQIKEEIIDRFNGTILGLAVGDAMGVPLEFKDPGTFQPVNDMIGRGPFNLDPGMWTDDTSLALCLMESLIQKQDFDPIDQLSRYLRWYQEGYLSVNDECFDIGNTTQQALMTFEETGEPYPGPDHERSAGNGSLMRLAPVPLFFMSYPLRAIEFSGKSSRTTHNHPLAVDACRYMGSLIHGALIGIDKKELLSPRYSIVDGYWEENPLSPEIDEVAAGSFKNREPPEIRGRGYVVKSLEAALWAFYNSESFKEGCLLAVNLGEDADTTGAIYGQLAGAYYGASQIPGKWTKLSKLDLIKSFIDSLLETSNKI